MSTEIDVSRDDRERQIPGRYVQSMAGGAVRGEVDTDRERLVVVTRKDSSVSVTMLARELRNRLIPVCIVDQHGFVRCRNRIQRVGKKRARQCKTSNEESAWGYRL